MRQTKSPHALVKAVTERDGQPGHNMEADPRLGSAPRDVGRFAVANVEVGKPEREAEPLAFTRDNLRDFAASHNYSPGLVTHTWSGLRNMVETKQDALLALQTRDVVLPAEREEYADIARWPIEVIDWTDGQRPVPLAYDLNSVYQTLLLYNEGEQFHRFGAPNHALAVRSFNLLTRYINDYLPDEIRLPLRPERLPRHADVPSIPHPAEFKLRKEPGRLMEPIQVGEETFYVVTPRTLSMFAFDLGESWRVSRKFLGALDALAQLRPVDAVQPGILQHGGVIYKVELTEKGYLAVQCIGMMPEALVEIVYSVREPIIPREGAGRVRGYGRLTQAIVHHYINALHDPIKTEHSAATSDKL